MKTTITFWGVRGSVPVFDMRNWRYGGNTACVEVRTPAGERIIIDGGTGLRGLGRSIAVEEPSSPVEATLLLSHYHWDHIQGLPFCPILYDPRNHLTFYGLRPESSGGMEGVLQGQMSRPYFPVELTVLAAARSFTELEHGARLRIRDALIEARDLHHPQGCLGFRIETLEGIVVYASDNEPGDAAGDRNVRELARDADVLIYDAQFLPDRLDRRRGWGHSTWAEGVRVARDAGVRHLVLFHHDPDSDDSMIDGILHAASQEWQSTWAATEGMVLSCLKRDVEYKSVASRVGPRSRTNFKGRLSGQREDGSHFQTLVTVENLSIKGAYVMTADALPLHSDVTLELSEWSAEPVVLDGRVVRCEGSPGKIPVGIGIMFFPRERIATAEAEA